MVDRPKVWLREVAEWSRRHGVGFVHCGAAEEGRDRLQGGDYGCGIVNASFTGLSVFDGGRAGRPWIVVSDHPCVEAAALAVESRAAAYLHEPVDAGLLLEKIGAALAGGGACGALSAPTSPARSGGSVETDMCVRHFLELTLRNLNQAASDLQTISLEALGHRYERPVCHLFNCPSLRRLRAAIRESIGVLERTRSAFKSRELAELRKKLEALMEPEQHE